MNHKGPAIYKSKLGLPAYKNKDNEEIYLLKFPLTLDNLKQDGTLKEDENFYYFEGYASTWTLDLGDDIIQQGAFAESLKKRKPKVLAFHDPDIMAGFSDEEFEDDIGLKVKGRIPKNGGNTPLIVPYMGEGGIDSLSIGFRIARDEKGEPMMDFINGVRIIKKCELFEYSFVTFPMNPAAKVGLSEDMLEEEKPGDHDVTMSNNEELLGKISDLLPDDLKSGLTTLLETLGHKNSEEKNIDFETVRGAEQCLITEFGLKASDAKTIISKIKALSDTRDDEETKEGELSEDDIKSLMEVFDSKSSPDELSENDLKELGAILKPNSGE